MLSYSSTAFSYSSSSVKNPERKVFESLSEFIKEPSPPLPIPVLDTVRLISIKLKNLNKTKPAFIIF